MVFLLCKVKSMAYISDKMHYSGVKHDWTELNPLIIKKLKISYIKILKISYQNIKK
jgi:hypothetical protein